MMITPRGGRLDDAKSRAIVVAPDPTARPGRQQSRRHRPIGRDAAGFRLVVSLQVRQRSRRADQPRRSIWLWKGIKGALRQKRKITFLWFEHQVFVERWRRSSCCTQSRPTSQLTEMVEKKRKRLRLCQSVIQADRRGVDRAAARSRGKVVVTVAPSIGVAVNATRVDGSRSVRAESEWLRAGKVKFEQRRSGTRFCC